MPGKIEALASVEMFRDLPRALLEQVGAMCREATYLRGESVFREGEPTRGLIVIWRGLLKVYKIGEAGREQILEIEGPGRSIAELPLFDGLPYPASCAAIEDSILLTMPPGAFHGLVAREPVIARSVISSLSRRLRHMVSLVEVISLKAVRGRLCGLLVDLAGGGDEVDLGLTHQEIAARIGTVREIVSRTLARLAREGAIRIDGRKVTILDRDLL